MFLKVGSNKLRDRFFVYLCAMEEYTEDEILKMQDEENRVTYGEPLDDPYVASIIESRIRLLAVGVWDTLFLSNKTEDKEAVAKMAHRYTITYAQAMRWKNHCLPLVKSVRKHSPGAPLTGGPLLYGRFLP